MLTRDHIFTPGKVGWLIFVSLLMAFVMNPVFNRSQPNDRISVVHALEIDLNTLVSSPAPSGFKSFEGNPDSIRIIISKSGRLVVVRYWLDNEGRLQRTQESMPGFVMPAVKYPEQTAFSPVEIENISFSFGSISRDGEETVIWNDEWHDNTPPSAVRWSAELCVDRHAEECLPIERTIFLPGSQDGARMWLPNFRLSSVVFPNTMALANSAVPSRY